MKKIIEWPWLVMILAIPQQGYAIDFGAKPRFETGAAYYELDQEPLATQTPVTQGTSLTISEDSISDVLAFVGGGVTFFVDRFIVDVAIQHYFNGNDEIRPNTTNVTPAGSIPIVQMDTVTENNALNKNDFDRTEWAVSLGFAVTENFALYAGYKHAKTNFDQDLTGQLITAPTASPSDAIPALSGSYTADADFEFEYDGPFVGATYNWGVKKGFLDGVLSGNIAVAFMDGSTQLSTTNFVLSNQLGMDIPVDVSTIGGETIGEEFEGDTIGLSVGLKWIGSTPVDDLTYAVGVNGYRYDFESDSRLARDLQETLVRVNFGLAYAF